MLPKRLEIHSILNSNKEVCEIHFGGRYDQFADAADQYDHYFRVKDPKLYDLVIASAGGYPKDINYIQAHKSIHNSASFVKDGGTLIILAECIDGVGNKAFMDLFRLGGREAIFDEMEKKYLNNAGTALATLKKSERIKIQFLTSLDEEMCRLMGMVKGSPEKAQELISATKGEVAWMANASVLYK